MSISKQGSSDPKFKKSVEKVMKLIRSKDNINQKEDPGVVFNMTFDKDKEEQ